MTDQMIGNVETEKKTELKLVSKDDQLPVSAPEKSVPAGCVERVLNFRDRNLIIGACREFCQGMGKGDYKAQAKLDKVSKIISFQETLEYFEMIEESMEEATFKWQRERNDWLCYQQYMSGSLTAEELKKRAPGVDTGNPPRKASTKKAPEPTQDEQRGKARSFYFPSKIDVWVQDALKVANWQPLASEYVTELCLKFGLKDED